MAPPNNSARPDMAGASQQRHRQDGAAPPAESWVEVSSHPSSSSVSSAGDEIVTTGLRVGNSFAARRRRLHPQYFHATHTTPDTTARHESGSGATPGGATSSQEEYEESESDEDRVLTSSTENVESSRLPSGQRQFFRAQAADIDSSEEDDDDDHATALGRRPSEPFRPQPNAFTHPPSHLAHRHSTSSAAGQHQSRPSFSQRSQSGVDRPTPYLMSPNHQADNDAALRASLTTLLSCAAAARSRPRDGDKETNTAQPAPGTQPVELRLVPESELMATSPPTQTEHATAQRSNRPTPSTSSTRTNSGDKIKRSTTPTTKSPRAVKKKRVSTNSGDDSTTFISPAFLTWVVSAGMVVLVSVVGFGAGYVIGREVGRQETLSNLGGGGGGGNTSAVADASSYGSEAVRATGGTLRRFRWGSGMGKAITA